ncbi:fasciclin domain-containing protein [Dyadobacter psychrophilus]|uniref:fasciclin domain-containing protein n=1 Tax=Dyadobacter psychrophilus TaxID=651661 RepID=UPI001131E9E0|nr:fasciclin domain-containing protein [Dyadobacter psychrophilus]
MDPVTGNIPAVASANPQFSTLVAALTKAELVTTLQGTGPFTVFAPAHILPTCYDSAYFRRRNTFCQKGLAAPDRI